VNKERARCVKKSATSKTRYFVTNPSVLLHQALSRASPRASTTRRTVAVAPNRAAFKQSTINRESTPSPYYFFLLPLPFFAPFFAASSAAIFSSRARRHRPSALSASAPERAATTAPLAHELVQGALVRWSVEKPDGPHPPTCVLVHGILGSRRNLQSLAKRLAEKFPSWQFLLVDLRNHGESNTALEKKPEGANTVQNAARDVLGVLNHLKIYPYTLIGHSFGGKVAMSMVHQFGRALPRPVQVWVLDTVPGDVWCDDVGDHPRDTIRFCTTLDRPIESRRSLVESLTGAGFTVEGAQWMTTNLRADGNGKFDWTFDLDGIAEMYASYEACDLWPMVETQPAGLSLDFVQAERSAFVWTPEDVARIRGTGANVHLLRNSAHWVHIDNPNGLLDILAPSFENMERNSKAR